MASNSPDDNFSFELSHQNAAPWFTNTSSNHSPVSISGPPTETDDCLYTPMQPLQRCPKSAYYTVERFTDSAVNMTYNTPTSQVEKAVDNQEIEDTVIDDEQQCDEGIDNEGDDHCDSPLLSDVFGPLRFSNGVTYQPPRNLPHRSSTSVPILHPPQGESMDWTRGRQRSCKVRSFFANGGGEASNTEDYRTRYIKQTVQVKSGSDINSSLTEMLKTRDFDSMFPSSNMEEENDLKSFEAEEDDKMKASLNFHKSEIDTLMRRPFITSKFIEDLPEIQDARKQPCIATSHVSSHVVLSAGITVTPSASETGEASRGKKSSGGAVKKFISRQNTIFSKKANNKEDTKTKGSEESTKSEKRQQTEERQEVENSKKGFGGFMKKLFNR